MARPPVTLLQLVELTKQEILQFVIVQFNLHGPTWINTYPARYSLTSDLLLPIRTLAQPTVHNRNQAILQVTPLLTTTELDKFRTFTIYVATSVIFDQHFPYFATS
jgi:hypothetical protein